MKGKEIKRRAIAILGMISGILVVFLSLRSCQLEKENEELKMLNQMLQDREELSCVIESGDITSEEWLMQYREIGLRFMNYLCEYTGEKEEVLDLIEQYQKYGEKILKIADLIEEGELEEAKQELEEVKELAKEVERSLEEVYEKAH